MRAPTHRTAPFLAAALSALLLALLALAPAPASAARLRSLAETFGAAAQPSFGHDEGLAVDQSTGDLLVIDTSTKTLNRFKPNGEADPFSALGTNVIDGKLGPGGKPCAEEAASCDLTGSSPAGVIGDFNTPREVQVAVAPAGSAAGTAGDIYVTNPQKNVIDVFAPSGKYLGHLNGYVNASAKANGFGEPCGVAVDASGAVYVGDFGGATVGDEHFPSLIHKFVPSANPPDNTDNVASFPFSHPCTLAAGAGPSAGALFATHFGVIGEAATVDKLDAASGAVEYVVSPGDNTTVSVDPVSGHVFAATESEVREYDASGAQGATLLARAKPTSAVEGIAVNGSTDKLYVARASTEHVEAFGPAVPFLPNVNTGAASPIGTLSTTLNGAVNPDTLPISECLFQYGTTTAYDHTAPCAETPAEIGTGSAPIPVHAATAELQEATVYHYRLVAANANGVEAGEDRTFKTPSPPLVEEQWVVEVLGAEATLRAKVNPEGAPSSFHVEYGPDTSYGQSSAEFGVGEDKATHTVTTHLSGLVLGTTYHWHVVATNEVGLAKGPDRTFTTLPPPSPPKEDCPNQAFRTAAAAFLPDCRAYEMVSPIDKNGVGIEAPPLSGGSFGSVGSDVLNTVPGALDQSAGSVPAQGLGLTFTSKAAFGDALTGVRVQYMARRDPVSGWSDHGISAPLRAFPGLERSGTATEFKAFSESLAQAWTIHDGEPPLAPCAPPNSPNLYRRDNLSDTLEALHCEPNEPVRSSFTIELQGVSSDGCYAVFRSNVKLTEDAAPAGPFQLYESSCAPPLQPEGPLRPIGLLPGGGQCAKDASAGSATESTNNGYLQSVWHAFSADARSLYWSCGEKLYRRSDPDPALIGEPGEESVEVAAPSAAGGKPRFEAAAAADGSRALFLNKGPGASEKSNRLWLYDAQSETSTPIAAGVDDPASGGTGGPLDLMGASEDARRAYFVSTEALSETPDSHGDKAVEGQPNLYFHEEGAPLRFIGALAVGEDLKLEARVSSPVHRLPIRRASRVSPSGLQAAFISAAPITGYDNTDQANGEADQEVFLYDASANGGAGQTFCVSCDPTGARPVGRNIGDNVTESLMLWAAARISGWQNQLYPGREFSEDGRRLFFQSFDDLLPRDTNAREDVYEWERATGPARCKEIGAELYVASAGGCLSLISSGQDATNSSFIDADKDGSDVFIRTDESLLPQDPGLRDIYDARVGGGLPPPPGPGPECEGEACQSPPSPPAFPTPSSSTFDGAGDLRSASPRRRCPKGKRSVRRGGKTRCLAKKARQHKEHRRGAKSKHRRAAR